MVGRVSHDTYVLMKSIVCAFNWSALCRSAKINVSAAVSTDRLTHKASSHITLSFSNAYCNNKDEIDRLGIRFVSVSYAGFDYIPW